MGECPDPRVCHALLPRDGRAAPTRLRHARVIIGHTRLADVLHAGTDGFRHWTLRTQCGVEHTVKVKRAHHTQARSVRHV